MSLCVLRILGFVYRGLLSVGLRAYLSGLNLLISRQILICKYGKLNKYLNTEFGTFFECIIERERKREKTIENLNSFVSKYCS